jgi:Family of unknown function (DUF6252)
MKKIISSTTLAFVFMAVACVKNQSALNCGKLPCPTAKGANVVSCYINGVPYIAKGGKPDLTGIGGCKQGSYITSSALGAPNATINCYFCKDTYAQTLHIYLADSLKVGLFELGSLNRITFKGVFFNVVTNDSNIGQLTITSITPQLVSGTFWFNASSGSGLNQYQITQGNFDIAR